MVGYSEAIVSWRKISITLIDDLREPIEAAEFSGVASGLKHRHTSHRVESEQAKTRGAQLEHTNTDFSKGSGSDHGPRLLGTHDDEPQHHGKLAKHQRENPVRDHRLVSWPEDARYT